jgi:radical SAM superfamily enzyme YgiQ (UPF0313 family)
MVGLPYETPETVERTIALNREVRPKELFCSVFFPFPGTHTLQICQDNGWITPRTVSSYFEGDYALEQPGITREQVIFYKDIFVHLVRHPRLDWWFRFLRGTHVTPTKTLWNLWRRFKAKKKEARLGLHTLYGRARNRLLGITPEPEED